MNPTTVRDPLFITGARVLDPLGELHRPPVVDIFIEGGRIAALGDEARQQALNRHTARIDAGGCLVTPGFVNAHSHSHDTLLRGYFEQLPLEIWGLSAFPTSWSPRRTREVELRTLMHARDCFFSGITTVQDMVTIVDEVRDHAVAVRDSYGRSGIRAIIAIQTSDRAIANGIPFCETVFSPALRVRLPRERDMTGACTFIRSLFAETGPPRVGWGLGPVQPQICSDALLTWAAREAKDHELNVFTHLYETRAEAVLARQSLPDDGCSMVARLDRLGLLGPNFTIAHGVWITPREVARLGGAGANLACNPSTNLKLLNGVAPLRLYASSGVNIGLGCDNSSASDGQNMFAAMKLFALGWGLQHDIAEKDAAARAFQAATIGGAAALGLGKRLGRIAPGYQADLVIFDLTKPWWCPLNSAVRQLVYGETGGGITCVLVDGEEVFSAAKTTRLDDSALVDEVAALRDDLYAELGQIQKRDGELAAAYVAMYRKVAAMPLEIDSHHLSAPVH
jgi:cytosine/adenosine deaminase-related metal-dependent hydrolase